MGKIIKILNPPNLFKILFGAVEITELEIRKFPL